MEEAQSKRYYFDRNVLQRLGLEIVTTTMLAKSESGLKTPPCIELRPFIYEEQIVRAAQDALSRLLKAEVAVLWPASQEPPSGDFDPYPPVKSDVS